MVVENSTVIRGKRKYVLLVWYSAVFYLTKKVIVSKVTLYYYKSIFEETLIKFSGFTY